MIRDLAVVGGGPVGLATAIEAAGSGLDVVVLEPRTGSIDKACGEGLMPGAVAALARWRIDPEGVPVVGIRYADARGSVEHRFRGPLGRGVRRTVLHEALAERAAALQVPVLPLRAERIEQAADVVSVGGVRARYLVGADGLHSTVRREAGLEGARPGPVRFGLRRHFATAPWSDFVEVHWRRGFELYITPVARDAVGVAVLGGRGLDLTAALAACPVLRERLGRHVDRVLGAGPLRQRAVRPTRGRIALVGDAAGYVDALTGEGLAAGFTAAREVVAALVVDDLPSYAARWRRTARAQRIVTEGLVRLAASPLRGAVVPIARGVPPAFAAVIDLLARPAAP